MSANKRSWLFPLLALGELIAIFILVPANCRDNNAADEDRSNSGEVCVLPRNTDAPWPDCDDDDDCPSDSSCLKGACVVTGQMDNEDGESEEEYEEEFDAGEGEQSAARSCETADDCGCGHDCVGGQCRKLDDVCCGNADCKAGEFCSAHCTMDEPCAVINDGKLSGTCLPKQCDTNEQCNKCGRQCFNHLCVQVNCCADADCPTGKLCSFGGNYEGYCMEPQCLSDADCGDCGKTCSDTGHFCTWYNRDRPFKCCGTDFYYYGGCAPHFRIENGRCIDDTHCPKGKTCEDGLCLPANCAGNADCGCEAVCRKGRCEQGCDDNSGCCDKDFPVCDRGRCVDPNAPDDGY